MPLLTAERVTPSDRAASLKLPLLATRLNVWTSETFIEPGSP
jgi:hypothetical protein